MFNNPMKKQEYLSREYLGLWVILAFQAGFVNAGGFMACARFVSHMTGFGTQVGISLSRLDYAAAIEMVTAPLSFLFGAIVSGFAVDRPLIFGKRPRYMSVMFMIFLVHFLVTVEGLRGAFGSFGEPLVLGRDYLLLGLLCFACGMQNACFGSLSRGQIRTTHLTGILTDIGVSFVKIFYLDNASRHLKLLKRINYIRILTFLSFSFGSAVSAILFSKLGYAAFAFPVIISGLLWLTMLYRERSYRALFTKPPSLQGPSSPCGQTVPENYTRKAQQSE